MTYLVRQDGANFYLYDGFDGLVTVVSYPHRVRDFDMTRASQARAWFIGLMSGWGLSIRFEGE